MQRFTTLAFAAIAAFSVLTAPATLASDCQCSSGSFDHGDKATKMSSTKMSNSDKPSIVQTAKQAGMFSTLLTAAKEAGLAKTLAEDGPFTVLAPTDDAFAKLPDGTLESLLKPENKETLKAILLYHVIDGEVMSDKVATMDKAPTLQGSMVDINASDEGVMVNDAKVVKADVQAGNGVIHVIDTVLIPSPKAAADGDADSAG